MPNPLDELYRGYQIHTWAVERSNGRFKPVAAVAPAGGPARPEMVNIDPSVGFETGHAAAVHALESAKRFVDEKG